MERSILKDFLAWCEIDLKAVRHNYRQIRNSCLSSAEILAVVKADAYGHGMVPVVTQLKRLGVKFFGVSNCEEAVSLRKQDINETILLFESTLKESAKDIVDNNLTPTICTLELAQAINRYAKAKQHKVDVHVKVDTGMGRLGVWHEDAVKFIKKVSSLSNLSVKGIYTHFPEADTNRSFTLRQVKILKELMLSLQQESIYVHYLHAANSMGLAGYHFDIFNLARPGLMLYGLYPGPRAKSKLALKPVMSVKARVIFLKEISKGCSISYGRTFIAKHRMKVATLPIGYSDGYFRCLSNKGQVLVGGKLCPVLGRVTMDQIVVDVSKVSFVRLGQEAVILGRQGSVEITAEDLAAEANTINYEIVCSLGNLLPRVYQ